MKIAIRGIAGTEFRNDAGLQPIIPAASRHREPDHAEVPRGAICPGREIDLPRRRDKSSSGGNGGRAAHHSSHAGLFRLVDLPGRDGHSVFAVEVLLVAQQSEWTINRGYPAITPWPI